MSLHLVTGEEPTLRAEATRRLVGDLLGDDDPTLALDDFTLGAGDGESDGAGTLAAALAAAATPPWGVARRVVVVRDVGALTTAGGDTLARFLTDPPPDTALVLVAGGGRIPVAVGKAVKAAGGTEVAAGVRKTADALTAALKAAGVRLDGPATKSAADWLGDDAGRVAGLADLLRSSFGEGARLDADDVAPFLGEAGAVPPYQLTGAIDRGDTAGALEVLHRLVGSGFHPLAVMAVLHRHYQRLLRLDDPGIRGEDGAVQALGGKVKPYPAGLAFKQARLLGGGGIRAAYALLARADIDLRGGSGAPPEAVVEILVARLAGSSRRAGAGVGRARPGRSGGRWS